MCSLYKNSYADIMRRNLNEAISYAIRDYKENNKGSSNFSRCRTLDMTTMIKLIMTMNGGSLNKELREAGIDATPSAFVQQRKKLNVSVFESILKYFNESCVDSKRFKGYEVYAIDGTCINLWRDKEADTYMKPTKATPKGYNQVHAVTLQNVFENTLKACDIRPQPQVDEIGSMLYILNAIKDKLDPKTIIIGDRGFESYNSCAFCIENHIFFVIRVKQGINAMKAVKELPMEESDTDLAFTLTTTQKKADKENGNIFINIHKADKTYKSRARRWTYGDKYHMKLRAVRVRLDNGKFETLVTNLPRAEITADDIKELYRRRWMVEISYRELKYTAGLVYMHGKCRSFSEQEILSGFIMMNFVNRIINQCVIDKAEGRKLDYQINHKMAFHLCKEFFRNPFADGQSLMDELAKYIEPVRADRESERKIKGKSFKGFVYRVSA